MNTAPQHAQDFTPEEYTRFRAVLKTQSIMKKEQVPLFFMDDMAVDDQGDVLRFKLAYMPPLLRSLDVRVTKSDSKMTLSWVDPAIPLWDYILQFITLALILSIVFSSPTFRADQPASFAFPAAMVVWIVFWFFVRKRHLREGSDRFAKAMESMSNRARYETQQSEPTAATA